MYQIADNSTTRSVDQTRDTIVYIVLKETFQNSINIYIYR